MKRLIILLTLFILIIITVQAKEDWNLETEKPGYVQGETVLSHLVYDSFDISKLHLYDQNQNEIPALFHFYSFENNSYIVYFNLDKSLAVNQALKLTLNDRRVIDNELIDVNLETTFNVSKGDNVFVVKPLFVIAEESGSVKLKLEHVKGNSFNVKVNVTDKNLKPVRDYLTLNPNEIKSLTVNYEQLDKDAMLKLSNNEVFYNVKFIVSPAPAPVINITVNKTEETEKVEPNITEDNITLNLSTKNKTGRVTVISKYKELKQTLLQNQTLEWQFYFNSTKTLHNVTFKAMLALKDYITFETEYFPVIIKGKRYEQKVVFNKQRNIVPGVYYDTILIESEEAATKKVNVELTFNPVEALFEENLSVTKPNVSLNFSEFGQKSEGNLNIALALILITVIIIILIAYKLRPKKKVKRLHEYVTELKKD